MSLAATPTPEHDLAGKPPLPERRERLLQSERDFYQAYDWCLNPFPTVRETMVYLRGEIDRLVGMQQAWQTGEVLTNVYLLSCALLNAADDYLRGKTFRLPRALQRLPFSRAIRWTTEKGWVLRRWRRRARVRQWRESFGTRLDAFLTFLVTGGTPEAGGLAEARQALAPLLQAPLPSDLEAEHIYFPSAFRRLDLTHMDVLELGRRLSARFPDRSQPILLLGLRTAGSYFAPLLRAFLHAEGYRTLSWVSVHTEKGAGVHERAELARCAREGSLAVILDDPPHTGDTIVLAVDMAVGVGFPLDRVAVLVPAHPARRDWSKSLSLSRAVIVSLAPEEWHKEQLLAPAALEGRLKEYFVELGYSNVSVVGSAMADEFNARLQTCSEDERRTRLKRVCAVRLRAPDGSEETRYVLAKSVGWGWLGYHAFLAGQRLTGFVPPLLGLRDGILFSEWLPSSAAGPDRERWISTTAAYVAARARRLGLGHNPLPSLGLHRHHEGFRLLEKVLARAYGRVLTAGLMRSRIRNRLAAQPCPLPTLIDAKMQRSEWITVPGGLLKTDYEHHGLGKNELNAIDPAYDLAEAILHLELSPEEEDHLLQRYAEASGDGEVRQRLFANKFLAGAWALESALRCLFQQPRHPGQQQELNRQFINALHFLTVHTARFCGDLAAVPKSPCWRSPLVALDIDGVLDRWIFGFPCTSAAGVQALALLHAHDFGVIVDTARSAVEVREYCRAYGLAGGVAEYGSYLWDAVGQRGRVLVSLESRRQLDEARKALAQLPGVFLDERYQHSIRAYTFEDRKTALGRLPIPSPLRSVLSLGSDDRATAPLPALTVQQLLASRGLNRLRVQQTTMDTTIRASEVDKGSGLSALLEWVSLVDAETMAVGDSEPDLAMFRAVRRCFAPAHIGCARLARLLGCRIARHGYQRGLLEVARLLAHPDGGHCPRCCRSVNPWPKSQDLFVDLLQAIDQKRSTTLLRALLDPASYQVLVR
jgi:hydroxymethylpyrimidine pyrophosphatase-like HAD family hydrolase